MIVEYASIATVGLERLVPNPALRETVRQGIAWKLSRDPGFQSRPCPAFPGRHLRVGRIFAGQDIRILFEVADRITIWSVGRASPEADGEP